MSRAGVFFLLVALLTLFPGLASAEPNKQITSQNNTNCINALPEVGPNLSRQPLNFCSKPKGRFAQTHTNVNIYGEGIVIETVFFRNSGLVTLYGSTEGWLDVHYEWADGLRRTETHKVGDHTWVGNVLWLGYSAAVKKVGDEWQTIPVTKIQVSYSGHEPFYTSSWNPPGCPNGIGLGAEYWTSGMAVATVTNISYDFNLEVNDGSGRRDLRLLWEHFTGPSATINVFGPMYNYTSDTQACAAITHRRPFDVRGIAGR